VTAHGGSLLAVSISPVVQFEKMQARDVLGLLGRRERSPLPLPER
jgi:hypothetical protein